MDNAARVSGSWTADEFLRTDQSEFGDAWRYELIDGEIVAHAAPSPDHGAILMGLGSCSGQPSAWQSGRLPAGGGQRRRTATAAASDSPHSRCNGALR